MQMVTSTNGPCCRAAVLGHINCLTYNRCTASFIDLFCSSLMGDYVSWHAQIDRTKGNFWIERVGGRELQKERGKNVVVFAVLCWSEEELVRASAYEDCLHSPPQIWYCSSLENPNSASIFEFTYNLLFVLLCVLIYMFLSYFGSAKSGLRYDDLYDPYYDLDVKEALNRLPREIVDARNQRLKRAIDLSMKHEYLHENLQVFFYISHFLFGHWWTDRKFIELGRGWGKKIGSALKCSLIF